MTQKNNLETEKTIQFYPYPAFFFAKSSADYITSKNMNTGGQPYGQLGCGHKVDAALNRIKIVIQASQDGISRVWAKSQRGGE